MDIKQICQEAKLASRGLALLPAGTEKTGHWRIWRIGWYPMLIRSPRRTRKTWLTAVKPD